MMTELEVQKLQQSMNANLNSGPRCVWKCVAGLLIIIAFLVAGNWLDPIRDPSPGLAQLQVASKFVPMREDD